MVKYPFTVVPDEDEFLVQFLDFPNGVTGGKDLEDAKKNAQIVLGFLVADYAEDGRPLPTPSPVGNNPFAEVW
jgi:predicted RNase H-like HicB family nuclease